ncbi:unnamed protein product [Arctogadus glacialis]
MVPLLRHTHISDTFRDVLGCGCARSSSLRRFPPRTLLPAPGRLLGWGQVSSGRLTRDGPLQALTYMSRAGDSPECHREEEVKC